MLNDRKNRKKLVRFIKKYTITWYVVTAIFYALAIPFTILVFPATTLILSVIVLFGGFTSSMAALASAIVSADDAESH